MIRISWRSGKKIHVRNTNGISIKNTDNGKVWIFYDDEKNIHNVPAESITGIRELTTVDCVSVSENVI